MKKKTIAALILMLVVAYGLTFAVSGVGPIGMPGCSENSP